MCQEIKYCIIGCSKTKKRYSCKAGELYQGALFKKSVLYCKLFYPTAILYILSAEYGLIPFDKIIKPYEKNLRDLNKQQQKEWFNMVQQQLTQYQIKLENTCFLTSSLYQGSMIALNPLKGLSQGRRLQFLNKKIYSNNLSIL